MAKINDSLATGLVFIKRPTVHNFQDLTGKVFKRLTALGVVGKSKSGNLIWLCRCDCGNNTKVCASRLRNGGSGSCGCFRSEKTMERLTIHGHNRKGGRTGTHRSWANMLNRCRNEKSSDYHRYGGRGISVCEEWSKFENFLADMGECPSKLYSIDRKDFNGNYEPNNCRWATKSVQANNTRTNVFITYNGKRQTVTQWERELGFKENVIWARLNKLGWTLEKAMTHPVKILKPRLKRQIA